MKDITQMNLDSKISEITKKLNAIEKRDLINADGDYEFDSNFGLLQLVYLP